MGSSSPQGVSRVLVGSQNFKKLKIFKIFKKVKKNFFDFFFELNHSELKKTKKFFDPIEVEVILKRLRNFSEISKFSKFSKIFGIKLLVKIFYEFFTKKLL